MVSRIIFPYVLCNNQMKIVSVALLPTLISFLYGRCSKTSFSGFFDKCILPTPSKSQIIIITLSISTLALLILHRNEIEQLSPILRPSP